MILHAIAHFEGASEYLHFLAKISPKITFYIARGHYIIAIYLQFYNGNMSQKILIKVGSKRVICPKTYVVGFIKISEKLISEYARLFGTLEYVV